MHVKSDNQQRPFWESKKQELLYPLYRWGKGISAEQWLSRGHRLRWQQSQGLRSSISSSVASVPEQSFSNFNMHRNHWVFCWCGVGLILPRTTLGDQDLKCLCLRNVVGRSCHTDSQVLRCGESALIRGSLKELDADGQAQGDKAGTQGLQNLKHFMILPKLRGKKLKTLPAQFLTKNLEGENWNRKETFPSSTNCVDEIPSPAISPWALRKVSLLPSSISPTVPEARFFFCKVLYEDRACPLNISPYSS